jgi:pyrimidine-specific ribonucleoside hydrolase
MNLIIETDVGHDPDDFFTICYLVAAGIDIRAIVVTPGDKDQLGVARTICKRLNLDVPIGFHKVSEKFSSSKFHHDISHSVGRPHYDSGDGYGKDIIAEAMSKYPDSQWLVIGPPSNIGRYLEEGGTPPEKCMMQGGFLGYHFHEYAKYKLDKFEGKTWVPTFNMNGDRKGTISLLESNIERRFCGKNVCHSVVFSRDQYKDFNKNKNEASHMFCTAAESLIGRFNKENLFGKPSHGGYSWGQKEEVKYEKKFHDPVAAVCMLHPEIGQWVKGKVQKIEGGWGTLPDENGDNVLAELDRDKFWDYLRKFE